MSQRRTGTPPDLDEMTFVEVIGTGGFSDVFKYHQIDLGRDVAVKVLLPGLIDQGSFRDEAKVMAKLSNHPAIVTIHHPGLTRDARPYLVMEYCPQAHLGARIRNRPLTVAQALTVSIQIAGAVETAHRLGIIHRDIKPANILFSEFGWPQLTDFGISVSTGAAQAGTAVGMSVPWAPPEQLRAGAPMGATGDVYSLAATLWTSLTGRSPFQILGGDNGTVAMAERVRNSPVPSTGREDVPESLQRIMRTAMAKDPVSRFVSALEYARALQGVQAELHHAVTQVEVSDERILDDFAHDEGQGGTRVTGFIAIDPEQSPLRPVITTSTVRPALTAAPANVVVTSDPAAGESLDATQLGRETDHRATPAPSRPDPAPAAPRGALAARAAFFGGLVVTVGAVIALVVNLGGTDPTDATQDPTSTTPSDPLPERLASPTGVEVARLDPRRVRVTWDPAAPGSGQTFAYWVVDPQEAASYREAKAPLVVPAGPGKVCIRLIRRRSGENPSESALSCWTSS